jgi:hypothetical protein
LFLKFDKKARALSAVFLGVLGVSEVVRAVPPAETEAFLKQSG